jgi:membrane-associated phospholipid phosphatase
MDMCVKNSLGAVAGGEMVNRAIWLLIAAVAVAVGVAAIFLNFTIVWRSYVVLITACLLLMGAAWLYRAWRKDQSIAAVLEGTSQLTAFTAVAAPLSYIAASANRPLQDSAFAAADKFLHFDWMALLGWMNAHPSLHPIFALAYASFAPQTIVTLMALAMTGHSPRIRQFLLTFILAALVTIAISAWLPAQGAWAHYGITPADHPAIAPVTRELHLAIFHGLRSGSFQLLTGINSEGIITFPSLHAAVALIFILTLWPVPVLRWVSLVVNVLMIIATPIDGGHYFIDVFAGLGLAALCWAGVSWLVTSRPAVRTILDPANVLIPQSQNAPSMAFVIPAPDVRSQERVRSGLRTTSCSNKNIMP